MEVSHKIGNGHLPTRHKSRVTCKEPHRNHQTAKELDGTGQPRKGKERSGRIGSSPSAKYSKYFSGSITGKEETYDNTHQRISILGIQS